MRTRRTPEEARVLILDAAADLLAEGGVAAVQVRSIAKRVGMTDAGVSHHFGTRDQLLRELLRHGGGKVRDRVGTEIAGWLSDEADIAGLVDALATVYRQGYGELALALHAAGWRDDRSGMLDPVVEALHARRRPKTSDRDDTRLAVAALHEALALEPSYGSAFRRSAGFTSADARDPRAQYRWWIRTVETMLGLPARDAGGAKRRRA